MTRLTRVVAGAITLVLLASPQHTAHAQWVTTAEQFYPGGSWNWRFLRVYPNSARLFNAFDYGHAILYEVLWRQPAATGHPTPGMLASWTFW